MVLIDKFKVVCPFEQECLYLDSLFMVFKALIPIILYILANYEITICKIKQEFSFQEECVLICCYLF